MRILVFEFISGGGLLKNPLPDSLLHEGLLMRNALLDDLYSIINVELLVLQDERITSDKIRRQERLQYLTVSHEIELQTLLSAQQETYDTVWIIAPETDGILAFWCHFFSQQGKILATSAQQIAEICEDKFRTLMLCQNAAIPCVPSYLINLSAVKQHTKGQLLNSLFNNGKSLNTGVLPNKAFAPFISKLPKHILKVNNSVGCEEVYIFESEQHWKNILLKLSNDKQYIIQPYIIGKVLSLSCLFYQGKAYFICCNEQHMQIKQQQFKLLACTVNIQQEQIQAYQILCQQIADVFPELFGYVGIDFIQTNTGENLLLEINPRLTSSYAGIKEALGINVAELVLGMLNHQPPVIIKTNNESVLININQENLHAG